jgi:hypothetical protein
MASNYQGIRFYNSLFITFVSLFCFLYQTFTHKESFALQYFESTEICFLQKPSKINYLYINVILINGIKNHLQMGL